VTWSLFASTGIKRNQVKGPQGLALDAQGNLYVADTLNNRVLRFNGGVPGLGVELAASGSSAGQVKLPGGLAVDATFTLFITDVANSRILKLVNAHTVAGSGSATPLATAGTGANQVRFPQGVAVDNVGNLYVADTGNSRILQFTGGQPGAGLILATVGSSLGQVRDAEGVTVSAFSTGNFAGSSFLVVGDTNNNRIQGRFLNAGEWALVGSPNGQGGNIGQFRTPSKIR
jgi:sugar lactone lactonase YvrE